MSALPPLDDNDVRFDIDHVMDRALAANEADIATHGRVLPTLADTVEVAYESFGIGLQKMTEQRYAEAVPWLATAVDNNVEVARPMLGISTEAAEPISAIRIASSDEREDALARQLVDDGSEETDTVETPIFDTVLADQRDGETPANTEAEEAYEQAGQVVLYSEFEEHLRRNWRASFVRTRSGLDLDVSGVLPKLLEWDSLAAGTFEVPSRLGKLMDLRFTPGHSGLLVSVTLVAEHACVCADHGHHVEVQCVTPSGLLVIQPYWRESRTVQTGHPVRTADVLPPITGYRPLPERLRPAVEFARLFDKARTGDPAAVQTVLQAIEPMVIRYCRARIGGRETSYVAADDVAQETCLAVLKALPDYRPEQCSFLYLVRALAAKYVEAAQPVIDQRRAAPVPKLPRLRSSGSMPAALPRPAVRPLDLGAGMQRSLMHLPKLLQEVIVLRVVVGLSAAETAEALGITAGAVRVAQHRAITRLRVGAEAEELLDVTEGVADDRPLGLSAAGTQRCLPGARL